MTSSDDEALDPPDIDYDNLTDECLSRTQARRRATDKRALQRDPIRPNMYGSTIDSVDDVCRSHRGMGIKAPQERAVDPICTSDIDRRSALRRSHRSRDALENFDQELHTVLQVFDFGLSEGAVEDDEGMPYSLDDILDESTSHVDEDEAQLLEDVAADALADLDLDPPSRQQSWDDRIGLAIEEVLTQHTDKSNPPPIEIKPHVKELLMKGEEAGQKLSTVQARQLSFDDIVSEMDIGFGLMNAFAGEMQENCPEERSDLSWCSASSASSLVYQRDQTLLKLLAALQSLYDEMWDCCLWTTSAITLGLLNLIDVESMDGSFTYVLKLLKCLRQLKDFELVMCCDGVGPAKVTKKRHISQLIEERLLELVEAMNQSVCLMQDSVLKKDCLEPNGGTLDRLRRSEALQQCWEGLKETTYRLMRCLPATKEQLLTSFLQTITSAASTLCSIQDTPQSTPNPTSSTDRNFLVQEVIKRVKRVISVKEDGHGLTDDEVAAREWFLPCLKKLHSIANDLSKQISRSRSFRRLMDQSVDEILSGLRRAFEELMFNSVAGMILITQTSEKYHLPEIQRRKDCGVRMMQIILKYDGGRLSDHSEESEKYETLRNLTGDLLNNVLRFQTKLQMYEIANSSVQEHEVSLSSSLSLSAFGSPMPDMPFAFKHLSEEQLESSRIGTVVTDDQSSGEIKDVPISDSTASLPNPFKNGPMSTSDIQLPDSFWPTSDRTTQNKSDIPTHPLSSLLESSPHAVPPPSTECPGMEHFWNIKKSELVCGPRLGSGSTGQVFKMSFCNAPVAVKIMHYPKLLDTQQRLVHEANMHMHLSRHPNIVQFYGQCVGMDGTDNAVGLVMELCNLGSLLNAIKEARWIKYLKDEGHDMTQYRQTIGYAFYSNWRLRLKLASDVTAGMEYLHRRGIVHRDLTSYNVVLSEGGRTGEVWVAKVCDFERSKYVPDGDTIPRSDTIPNSPAWSAPEVLRNEDYSTQADVFSMGVILWEIITLDEPWRQHFSERIRDPFRVIALVSNRERLQIPLPEDDSVQEYNQLTELIEDAWKETPNERPTMKGFHDALMKIRRQLAERHRRHPTG